MSLTPAQTYTWSDPAPMGRAAVIALRLMMATNAAFGLGTILRLRDLRGLEGAAVVGALPNDNLWVGLTMLHLAATSGGGVFVIRWLYRSSRNAHAAADGLRFSPASNIWWYLVPLASLFKPFQAMQELWRVSAGEPPQSRTPPLLDWWWGAFVLTALVSTAATLAGGRKTAAALTLEAQLTVLAVILGLVTATLFVQVVDRVTAMQLQNLRSARGRGGSLRGC